LVFLQALFTTGLGLFFSAFNLFWRDIYHLMGVAIVAWMFATPIFYPEYLVEKAGYIWLAVIGVLMSAVSAYFYLRVLVVMYMQEPADRPEFAAPPWAADAGAGVGFSLWACALSILVLGIWPGWLSHFAQQALQGLWRLL
jgi:NADH-quinone oxidoreductase subunit N